MTRIVFPIGALAITLVAVGISRRVADEPHHTAGRHGLEGWVARKITDEQRAKKEIEKLLEEMHAGYRDGDQQAVAALMDFPVLMITDDWKGDVIEGNWDRTTWMQRMAPLFRNPPHELQRAHHHTIFVISDSLASVEDEQSVLMGKKHVTIRSSSIVIRKDRRWVVKSAVEAGWGDTPLAKPPAASQAETDADSGYAAAAAGGAPSNDVE